MTVQDRQLTVLDRCTCRQCNFGIWGLQIPQEMEIARAVEQFVTDEPRWRTPIWAHPLSWLESELDEVLGLTHARWMTRQLRAARDRA